MYRCALIAEFEPGQLHRNLEVQQLQVLDHTLFSQVDMIFRGYGDPCQRQVLFSGQIYLYIRKEKALLFPEADPAAVGIAEDQAVFFLRGELLLLEEHGIGVEDALEAAAQF